MDLREVGVRRGWVAVFLWCSLHGINTLSGIMNRINVTLLCATDGQNSGYWLQDEAI